MRARGGEQMSEVVRFWPVERKLIRKCLRKGKGKGPKAHARFKKCMVAEALKVFPKHRKACLRRRKVPQKSCARIWRVFPRMG